MQFKNFKIIFNWMTYIIVTMKTVFFCIWAILIRGTLPRYRFDQLVSFTWKHFIFIWFNFFLINSVLFLIFL